MWYLLFFLWLFLLVFSQHIYFHSYIIQAILWSAVTDLYTFNSLMGYNNILCQNTTEFYNPFEFSSAWEDMYHKSCRCMLCFVASQPELSLQYSPSPLSSLQLENVILTDEWTDESMLHYDEHCTWTNSCVVLSMFIFSGPLLVGIFAWKIGPLCSL